METPNIIIDEKTKRYKAGDVVMLEYTGKDKPCKKAMAVLLTPFTVKDAHCVGDFRTLYAIDTDKERFLKAGPIGPGDVQCKIAKVRSEKLKTWYFGKILEQCMKPEKKQYVWVFTGEQAWDGEEADVVVRSFGTEKAARKFMQEFIHDNSDESIAEYVERKGWEVEYDEPDLYRAFEDGYYNSNHIELTITKCEIEK